MSLYEIVTRNPLARFTLMDSLPCIWVTNDIDGTAVNQF